MNKPTPFGKTYKEYTEAVEKFSKVQKIELQSILTDQKLILEKANSEIRVLGNKLMAASVPAEKAYNEIKQQRKSIASQAKDLGIDVKIVKDYKESTDEMYKYDKLAKEFGL